MSPDYLTMSGNFELSGKYITSQTGLYCQNIMISREGTNEISKLKQKNNDAIFWLNENKKMKAGSEYKQL